MQGARVRSLVRELDSTRMPQRRSYMPQLRPGPGNKDEDVENGLEDTGRGKGKVGQSERVAWTYIHYQM